MVLQLAGKDATTEFDPVHPAGTLQEHLPIEAKLGRIETIPVSYSSHSSNASPQRDGHCSESLDTLLNIDDIEKAATKRISHKAWAYYFFQLPMI